MITIMPESPSMSEEPQPKPSSVVVMAKSSSFGKGALVEGSSSQLREGKRTRLDTDSQRGKRLFSQLLHHARPTPPSEADLCREALRHRLEERLAQERKIMKEQLAREAQARKEAQEAKQKEWERIEEERLRERWRINRQDRGNFLVTKTHPPLYWIPAEMESTKELVGEYKLENDVITTNKSTV